MMGFIFIMFFISILFMLVNKEKLAILFSFIGIVLIVLMLKYHATDALNLVF